MIFIEFVERAIYVTFELAAWETRHQRVSDSNICCSVDCFNRFSLLAWLNYKTSRFLILQILIRALNGPRAFDSSGVCVATFPT